MLSAVATNPAVVAQPAESAYYAVAAWESAKAALEQAKAAELAARLKMAALLFPEAPDAGTAYHPLRNGWRLKGTFALNYRIDRDNLPEMLAFLTEHSNAGAIASETTFRYKPELVMSSYSKLLPSLRAIVDTVLTTDRATPAFELVAPKGAAS